MPKNQTEFYSKQIGMGEPVQEEVEKLAKFWAKFKNFTKTKKFILLAVLFFVAAASIITIAVILQIPQPPVPPKATPTPTPTAFPTKPPQVSLPPLSQEALQLEKQVKELNYDEPIFTFPSLDWKITLKEKS